MSYNQEQDGDEHDDSKTLRALILEHLEPQNTKLVDLALEARYDAILDGFAAAQQENQEPSSELITAAQQLYAELGERQERRDRLIAELDRFTDRKSRTTVSAVDDSVTPATLPAKDPFK